MTVLEEKSGQKSMRRLLALIFSIDGLISGNVAICRGSDWQTVAVSFGIPIFAAVILLFFTTWGDITEIVKAWKKE